MNKEINEIINNLEQTLGWCDRITTGNLPHKIGNLKQCLVSTIELLKVLNIGWHPASELPVIPEGKFSVSVIAYCSTPSGIYAPVEIAYRRTGGWQYESVKWWCYPPQND